MTSLRTPPTGGGQKNVVICSTPGFLGVVGACACNGYQALFPPPFGPGYEASHIYTSCTDTRNRDQSEIKWSSYKIGDDQAIKIRCSNKGQDGSCPLTPPTPRPPRLSIKGQRSISGAIKQSRNQGSKMAPIKF